MIRLCPGCNAVLAPPDDGPCPACLLRLAIECPEDAAPAAPQPSLGHVGRYELRSVLGSGAVGVVHRAWDPLLRREVAIKTLYPHLSGDALRLQRERFRQEAAIVAQLDHPHVVLLYDHGEHDGAPYLVQKLFPMGDLASAVSLPVQADRAARWLRDLADAVAEAHQRGILHRDIKPSNVFLDDQDDVFLGDFGIARLMSNATRVHTLTGQALGSPGYMAPEQAMGRAADVGPAADIHGLGALLHHLLTGLPPFQGSTVESTLRLVVEEEPIPVRRINPGVPADLETLCLKCLEKNPAHRYRNALELRDDLDRFMDGRPIHARPLSAPSRAWRWCRRRPSVAALVACLVVSLVGGLSATTAAMVRMHAAERGRRGMRDDLAFQMLDVWAGRLEHRAALDSLANLLREDPGHVAAMRRAWNILDRERIPVPMFELSPSNCIAGVFDRSGDRILLWSSDSRIALFDANSGRDMGGQALATNVMVVDMGFSPSGDHAWVRYADDAVKAWSLPSWRPYPGAVPPEWHPAPPPLPPSISTNGVLAHEFSPDGRHVVLRKQNMEREYELVEVATGRVIRTSVEGDYLFAWRGRGMFPGPDAPSRMLTWAVDKVMVRDVATGLAEMSPIEWGVPIEFACFHPSGRRALVAPLQGRPMLFAVPDPPPAVRHLQTGMDVAGVTYSPDGKWLAVEGVTKGVQWLPSGALDASGPQGPELKASRWVAWTDHGMLAATLDGRVFRCVPGRSNPAVALAFKASGPIAAIAASPDRQHVATITTHGLVELWDARRDSGRPLASSVLPDAVLSQGMGDPEGVTGFAFSRSGGHLAMSLNGGRAEAWNVPAMGRISLQGARPYAYGNAIHPTRPEFVLADLGGQVLSWRLDEGPAPQPLSLDALPFVGRATFDRTGRHLVLAAMGGRVQVRAWPPTRGTPHTWSEEGGAWHVRCLAASDSFLLGTTRGILELRSIPRIWPEARWTLPVQGHVNWLAVAPDDSRIAAGMNCGFIFEIELPPVGPAPDWFVDWVEAHGRAAILVDPNGPGSLFRRLVALRTRLEGLRGDDFWSRWGRSVARRELSPGAAPADAGQR